MNVTSADILKIVAVVGLHLLAILYDGQLLWVAFGADLTILGIQVGSIFSSQNGAKAASQFVQELQGLLIAAQAAQVANALEGAKPVATTPNTTGTPS